MVLTDIDSPPSNFAVLDLDLERLQDFACFLKYLVGTRPVLVNSSGGGIYHVAVISLLNVETDVILPSRDNEEHAFV